MQENIYKNADISKKFFGIIDQNNEGGISDKEFANPLISLGLATDPGFVRKVMRILAPKKFRSFQDYKEEELTLKEFANLFKSDPVGERLVNAIREEIMNEKFAKAEKIRKREILKRRYERLNKSTDMCFHERININLKHIQLMEYEQMMGKSQQDVFLQAIADGRSKLEKKVSFELNLGSFDRASKDKGASLTQGNTPHLFDQINQSQIQSSFKIDSNSSRLSTSRSKLTAQGAIPRSRKGEDSMMGQSSKNASPRPIKTELTASRHTRCESRHNHSVMASEKSKKEG